MVWNEPGKNNNKDPWESGEHSHELEKLVKNIQQKLAALFGGKRPGRNSMHPATLLWILPLLVIVWLGSGFYAVTAGDRGVVCVFGRVTAITQPGVHWRAPWPIGTQLILSGVDQGRDYTHQYNQLVTSDGDIAVLAVQVHYQIDDIRDYLFKVAAPGAEEPGAKLLLAALADSAVRGAVARFTLADLLGDGRDQVEAQARDLLQATLKRNDAGIAVTRLSFQRVDVPDAVSAAYADVRKAREDAQQLKDTAQVYSSQQVTEAQGESDAQVTEAEAYRVTRTSEAKAEVARFKEILAAYRAEPALTRDQLYLQTMQQVLGKASKVVMDSRNGNVTVQFTQPAAVVPAKTVAQPATDKSAGDKPATGDKGGK